MDVVTIPCHNMCTLGPCYPVHQIDIVYGDQVSFARIVWLNVFFMSFNKPDLSERPTEMSSLFLEARMMEDAVMLEDP